MLRYNSTSFDPGQSKQPGILDSREFEGELAYAIE
jgi:hypothetical protein